MRGLIVVGLVLVALGGGLMVFDEFRTEEKHEATILGKELSVTTTEKKRIPLALSGTILGLGAALTLVGALRKRR